MISLFSSDKMCSFSLFTSLLVAVPNSVCDRLLMKGNSALLDREGGTGVGV